MNPAAGAVSLITLFTDDSGAHWLIAVTDTRPLAHEPFYINPQGNGPVHFAAPEAMTLALGNVMKRGTGTLAYARALSATPLSFSAVSGNTSLAVGDVLRITVSGYSGYLTLTIPRAA